MQSDKASAAPMDASRAKNDSKSRYFLTWRWHFYAGLFVIPFMLILSLTGLVMLFDDEIEFNRYQTQLEVTPQETRLKVSTQLDKVVSAYPEAVVTQFIPAPTPDLANRFSIKFDSGETRFITVDPFNGQLLGSIDRSDSWYQLANDIHGTLLIGDWGDYLIEIAASLSVVLLVSGIYLWLPRDAASKAGFLTLRWASGSRIFMRDLHANLGGVLSIVMLLFLISGLAWAGVWGSKFVQPWSSFPAQKWDDVPLSTLTHASMNHGSEEEVPWNLEQTLLPESHDHSAMLAQNDSNELGSHAELQAVNIDQLLSQAKALGFTQFKLNFPRSETGVYTLTANTMSGDVTDPRLDRTTHIDQYSGKILADVTWDDYSVVAKLMAAGIALHQGDISILNKILNVVFCLAFIVIAVTGGVMWWIRRPTGQMRIGAPPRFESDGLWKAGIVTIIILGLVMPMAGGTIAVMLIIDWLIFQRVSQLKSALN
ncbi:PepSY domain-containing protein [Vibrio cortegadensis]|uniref:PepSY-associated TM helix domain-containing protein n=1 Tax=Vibrio cortegadensis TaxID=1328770 RepID=UPI0021C3F67D|nr:PepSY domain-containing protein [Vibrio cortegadensis]MDN3697044.1 PepSY domain-containing protein [Vibrio cortegadensis]